MLSILFFVLIASSSFFLLAEFPWNGNLVDWLKARESYEQANALQGRYMLQDAEKHYNIAIKAYPGDWRFYLSLGDTLLSMHRYSEAEAAYKEVIKFQPKNFDAWLNLADCLSYKPDRLIEAEKAARTAVSLDPANPVALAQLAFILQEAGKVDEAEKTLKGASSLEKDSARFWYLSGKYHWVLDDLQRSETEFRQAAELDKTNAEYWQTIGLLLFDKNDLEGAEHYLRRACLLNPYEASYWAKLGEVWRLLKDPEKSEDCYLKACQLEPKNSEYWLNLGLTRYFQRKYARSEEPFKKAIEANPEDIRAFRPYINALERQRKYKEIEEVLGKFLSDPVTQDSQRWAYLAAICIKATDFDRAELAISKAEALAQSKEERDNVAMLKERLKQTKNNPDKVLADAELEKEALKLKEEEEEKSRQLEVEKQVKKRLKTQAEMGDLDALNKQDKESTRRY